MSSDTDLSLWVFVCTVAACPMNGIEYTAGSESAECGGCGAVYTRAR